MPKGTVIIHNIVSPYKTLLFNSLATLLDNDLEVLYCASTSNCREWNINYEKIRFAYTLLNQNNLEDIPGFKLAQDVWRWLNRNNPQVVIVGGYDLLAMWSAWLWAGLHGKRFVVIVESHYQDHKRVFWKEFIKRIFLSKCDAVVAAGSKHRDYVSGLGVSNDKIYVMKGVGGVDPNIYLPYRQCERSQTKIEEACQRIGVPAKRYFIYVGRFAPEKNLLSFLQAFVNCRDLSGWNEWGILLVGNGPLRDEIQQFIVQQNLDNVFCPGFVQQEKLPWYYAASAVFILPSVSEPWGLVVDEAMTMGLPVQVSNRCGCVPDIVQDGVNGLTFDPFSEEDISAAIKKIMTGCVDLDDMSRKSLSIIDSYNSDHSAKVLSQVIGVLKNV